MNFKKLKKSPENWIGFQYLGGLKLGIEKKHIVNNLDIEKKKGLHIIL